MPKPNAPVRTDYQPCPDRGSVGASLLGFTWWGGLLGPKLLTHVKCPNRGTKYNGKTGGSNTTGILLYTGFGVVLGIALLVLIAMLGR